MSPSSSASSSASSAARYGTRGVLFAMCLCLVLVVASVSALNLALPELAVSLSASNADLTWIADAYTVALAALVLPLGAIGDRYGRRNVLIAGCLVFGATAALAATADTATHLIWWRAGMGIGAAMIMPGTLSTITAAFPEQERARGVAVWSGFAAAGAILGLLAAGSLLERWDWKSIFIASAITAVVAAAAALALAPNTKDDEHHPFDLGGAAFTCVGIGTLVFGIIEGSDRGWTEPYVVGAFVVSVMAFAGYALHGMRAGHPLLDPRLFGNPGFRAGAVTVLTQFMAVFGFFYVGLQFLQLILDYSPLKSAVALVPVAVVVLPMAAITPTLVRRVGLRLVMSVGLLLLAVGLGWIGLLDAGSGYLPFLLGVIVAGIGIGLTSSTGTASIVGSLSRGQQGVASAMNDTTREVGAAVGIALVGSVFSAAYEDNLPDLRRLPPEASAGVTDSAAAGLAVAERLGGATGSALADGVREAFISGLSAAMFVTAGALIVAAVGAFLRAPRALPSTDEDD